jgi:restriction system protein
MKQSISSVPTFDSMLLPTIQALQILGGSGTTEEILEKVVQILNVPDKILEILHGSTSQTEIEYRLAWSRTYLKKYGLLQNSSRGVWSLVSTSIDLDNLQAKEIVKVVKNASKNKTTQSDPLEETIEAVETLEDLAWHQQLHQVLLSLDPAAFERLAQRLLRESGFIQVQVMGELMA